MRTGHNPRSAERASVIPRSEQQTPGGVPAPTWLSVALQVRLTSGSRCRDLEETDLPCRLSGSCWFQWKQ